jgi:hypothetical protein
MATIYEILPQNPAHAPEPSIIGDEQVLPRVSSDALGTEPWSPALVEDPYSEMSHHTFYNQDGAPVQYQIIAKLGDSSAVVLLVTPSHHETVGNKPFFVLKVFDPRFSLGLRESCGLEKELSQQTQSTLKQHAANGEFQKFNENLK